MDLTRIDRKDIVEIAEHITGVEVGAELIAEAVREGGLEADIAGCPGWNMRALVRHLSEIHLWAAAIVAQRTSKLWPEDLSVHTESWPDLAIFWPDDDELVDWYLETNANLVRCLEATSPADDIPYFLKAPSPRSAATDPQTSHCPVPPLTSFSSCPTGLRTRPSPSMAITTS